MAVLQNAQHLSPSWIKSEEKRHQKESSFEKQQTSELLSLQSVL
jgi:hypothetical protein